jgi:hypothetical protein
MCVRKTPLAEVFFFLPGNGARKYLVPSWRGSFFFFLFFFVSPATAPENMLDA